MLAGLVAVLQIAAPAAAQLGTTAVADHDHTRSGQGGNSLGATRARSVQFTTNNSTAPSRGTNPNTLYANNIVKAWVAFNDFSLAGQWLDGFNVSSVTALGGAYYRVNFSTPFADTNYAAVCTAQGDRSCAVAAGTRRVKSVDLLITDKGGFAFSDAFYLIALGRQANLSGVNGSTVTSVQNHTHASATEGGASLRPTNLTVTSTASVAGSMTVGTEAGSSSVTIVGQTSPQLELRYNGTYRRLLGHNSDDVKNNPMIWRIDGTEGLRLTEARHLSIPNGLTASSGTFFNGLQANGIGSRIPESNVLGTNSGFYFVNAWNGFQQDSGHDLNLWSYTGTTYSNWAKIMNDTLHVNFGGGITASSGTITGLLSIGYERRSTHCAAATNCPLSCTAGKVVTGGGCYTGTANFADSYPSDNTTWQCDTTVAADIDAYILCARLAP